MRWFGRGKINEAGNFVKETSAVSLPAAVAFTVFILIISGAVAFTLFWTGRWAYNRFIKDNAQQNTSQTSSQRKPESISAPATVPSGSTQNSSANTGSTSSNNAATSAQTPNTGPAASQLPNTGPEPE